MMYIKAVYETFKVQILALAKLIFLTLCIQYCSLFVKFI